jgi:cytochrome c peroxidase
MHDGSLETLEEVVEYYSDPYMFIENPINMDSIMIEPLKLTYKEKEDLVNFLHSLTDETRYEKR